MKAKEHLKKLDNNRFAEEVAMATRGKQLHPATDVAYLAGLIDADGCISISKMKRNLGVNGLKSPRYVVTVNIVNTSKELMEWLVETFGGRYKCRRRAAENHKATYDWWFNNSKSLRILVLVEPFLKIKKDRAKVCIDLLSTWEFPRGRGARLSDAEIARREEAYQTLKKMNQFGCAAATTKSLGSCSAQQDDVIV